MAVAGDVIAVRRPAAPARFTMAALGLAGMVALGAVLAFATFGGQEATAIALLIGVPLLAAVVVRPQVGVLLVMTNYLFASYPTPIRGEGLLTINNVLGVILTVLMLAELAQRPDLWFLKTPQFKLYVAIGLLFIAGTVASQYAFPELRATWGKRRMLDQTAPLAREFITRLAYVILASHFLSTKQSIKWAIGIMMGCLILVVPSALWGYVSGRAEEGYRAAAEFSIGTNANRLAFLCLMQAALWWYLAQTQRAAARLLSYGLIASLILTLFLTASRSGFLGLGVLMFLLTRSRGSVQGGGFKVAALALVTVGMLLTIVPEENLERVQNLNPFATRRSHEIGAYSTERRVATVDLGWQIFKDHPVFGVGLGNFREVARQIYVDPFYRSPHNSFIWSLSEGGLFCFLLFLALFYVTWRDIRWIQDAQGLPHDLRWFAAGLEPALLLLLFYSFFADMFLSPVTYILVILVMIFRRYVSARHVVVV